MNRSHQKPAWRPPLSAQVLIALVLGILFGVMGGSHRYWLGHGNEDLGHIGMLVIRLLKALAIPLILFSILDTFAKTHISARSGFRLVLICLVNVSVAFAIGLSLMNGLKPGLSLQGTFKALLAQTDPWPGRLPSDPRKPAWICWPTWVAMCRKACWSPFSTTMSSPWS